MTFEKLKVEVPMLLQELIIDGEKHNVCGFRINPWDDEDSISSVALQIYSQRNILDKFWLKSKYPLGRLKTENVHLKILSPGQDIFFFNDDGNLEQGEISSLEEVHVKFFDNKLKIEYLIERPIGENLWIPFESIKF